jgi:hypothetical protein
VSLISLESSLQTPLQYRYNPSKNKPQDPASKSSHYPSKNNSTNRTPPKKIPVNPLEAELMCGQTRKQSLQIAFLHGNLFSDRFKNGNQYFIEI